MYTDKYDEGGLYGVPMPVVIARHRAVMTHKCGCRKLRDPSHIKRVGSRTWISCLRCLGTIKQLS